MDESAVIAVRRAAMELLARREHSKLELRQKLARRFSDCDLVDSEIDKLCSERLQSDERCAEMYLRSRAQKLYGPFRIKAELRERGIADEVVAKVMADADIDWPQNLRKLEITKFGRAQPSDMKEKAKRLRFFQYRGFCGISRDVDD